MSVIIWILVFLASLAVLVKFSEVFLNQAKKIGLYFGLSPFIVGVTIVAIGTTLPELSSSIIASTKGAGEIVLGNVIGSCITNILLIIGISAIISKKIKIKFGIVHVSLPLLVGSAFLLAIALIDGKFNLYEGILFLVGFILYLLYSINEKPKVASIKKVKKGLKKDIAKAQKIKDKPSLNFLTWFLLVLSTTLIYFGAKYLVESILTISKSLNMGTEIISMTVVALGTSLPELAVAIVAARKGLGEIAVGNILGANIINTFLVLGVSGIIHEIAVPKTILLFPLPFLMIVTLLYFFISQDKEIRIWEGALLLLFYVFFIAKTFSLL